MALVLVLTACTEKQPEVPPVVAETTPTESVLNTEMVDTINRVEVEERTEKPTEELDKKIISTEKDVTETKESKEEPSIKKSVSMNKVRTGKNNIFDDLAPGDIEILTPTKTQLDSMK